MVDRGQLGAVLRGEVLVLHLVGGGLDMLLVLSLHLHRRGPRLDAGAAVEADVIRVDDGVCVDDGAILVDVGHVDAAEVRHGAVVGEDSAAPLAAEEADAAVAESVVNPAIEADVRAPVAGVPSISAARKSPVAGGPQNANTGRLHPNAGNPVVASVPVGPVAGGPDIARGGQRGLHVHGQGGRSNVHGDTDADGNLGVRDRQSEHWRGHRGGDEQPAKSRENRHELPPQAGCNQ